MSILAAIVRGSPCRVLPKLVVQVGPAQLQITASQAVTRNTDAASA